GLLPGRPDPGRGGRKDRRDPAVGLGRRPAEGPRRPRPGRVVRVLPGRPDVARGPTLVSKLPPLLAQGSRPCNRTGVGRREEAVAGTVRAGREGTWLVVLLERRFSPGRGKARQPSGRIVARPTGRLVCRHREEAPRVPPAWYLQQ